MDPTSQPKDGFRRAADSFKASIRPDLAEKFVKLADSLESLKHEIKTIQDDLGKRGSLRNLSRLKSFIEAMNQLGQVIEVFVNANDLVCFIWGPMKFLLGVAKTHLETFDKLLDVYAQIGDVIPGLLFYQDMFLQHEPLRDVLQDYYSDILKFHEAAIKVLGQSKWKDVFHATWKTFNTQFDPIMQSLTKRRELLESVKLSASLDQVQIIRRQISDVYQEQMRSANENAQEKHLSRMAMIKEKLRASEYFLDQEIATQRRDGLDTGQWIFEEPKYLSWADTDALGHSVLYINGIPGAGKTTLVSLIISKLLEVHAPSQPLQVPDSVSYFYFKNGDVEKNSHESALRAILTQLISQNTMSSEQFLEDFSKQADVNVRSRRSLETFTKRALEEYRVSYLILDGLDECEREQAKRTTEWFLSILEDDRYSGKTSVRLIFSGQRDGLLDNVLLGFPSIRLESTKHDADIANYCSQYASKLKHKFRLTKELENNIGALVTKGAQGMFLYARIVLEYLFRQVSLKGLKNAISPGVFPRKLETAYQRIAATILDAEFRSETEAARRLVCLVLTAKRDLRWREIQAFFCIDSEAGTIDPDNRLLVSAKELCGSLVDVHEVNGRRSESESVVRIVHYTAGRYLIENGLINGCVENAKLLSFCSSYLISSPFSRGNRSDTVSSHARQAFYSLQDYSVAHWHDHLIALGNATQATQTHPPQVVQELEKATCLTRSFLKDYATSLQIPDKDETQLSPQMLLNMLPRDGKERTSILGIEQRTSWIRHEIEDLQNLTDEEKAILDSLYGPIAYYKCPKPDCDMFSEGFKTKQERANHVNCHNRPFYCNDEVCIRRSFGFESHGALERHVQDHHSKQQMTFHFPRPRILGTLSNGSRDVRNAASVGDLNLVKRLLDDGADINDNSLEFPSSYRTPLWLAADGNHYELCKFLIQRGANVGKTAAFQPRAKNITQVDSVSPCTPLAQACIKGNIRIVELILETYAKTANFANSGIRIGFMKAVAKGHLETVQLLISYYDFTQDKDTEDGPSDPLLVACERQHASMLDLLLQNGFEFQIGVNYVKKCISANRLRDTEEGRRTREQALKVVLDSGQPQISRLEVLNLAISNAQPSMVLLILSYPKTDLVADDLFGLRLRLARKAQYNDVVKLIDKLLQAKEAEVSSKSSVSES